jgi:hypothetical protein
LIEDRLIDTRPHRYELRFHLAPGTQDRVIVRRGASGATVVAPGVALVVAGPATIAVEDGWIAPQYGLKFPAPVVIATQENVAQAEFLTLVAPLDAVQPSPTLHVRSDDNGLCVVEVTGVGADGRRCDRLVWSIEGREEELPGFGCRAAAAWMRDSGAAPRRPHPARPVDIFADASLGPVTREEALR